MVCVSLGFGAEDGGCRELPLQNKFVSLAIYLHMYVNAAPSFCKRISFNDVELNDPHEKDNIVEVTFISSNRPILFRNTLLTFCLGVYTISSWYSHRYAIVKERNFEVVISFGSLSTPLKEICM